MADVEMKPAVDDDQRLANSDGPENVPVAVKEDVKAELDISPTIPDILDQDGAENNGDDLRKFDLDRVHISNLPRIIGFLQFKKFLARNLPGIQIKKVRQMSEDAYVSFESSEDASKAVKLLNGIEIKRCALVVTMAQTEERKVQPHAVLVQEHAKNPEEFKSKTARESVTPLADMPYDEQLALKNKNSFKTAERLITDLRKAGYTDSFKTKHVLREIKASPKTTEYRNKCEFTIGLTLEGKICVGFVGGRFSKNQHYVIPIEDVDNITNHTKKIVNEFEKFVIESGLPPMDEFARSGVWKMLTVREFGGDVMIIVTVFPLESSERETELKKKLCEKFLDMSTFSEGYRVTSLYWQSIANCSDAIVYEHIGGTPYIYETVLDCRFRVSPSAFFQTNSHAAAVLYSTIGEACGLESRAVPVECNEEVAGETEAKKIRLDSSVENDQKESGTTDAVGKGTILLDICCGTGTIGQCLLKKYQKSNDKLCCVGIEMVSSAVEDAKQNAKNNGMDEKSCKYIAGKAEDVFRSLRYHLPTGFNLETDEVVGVLDPPRAGLHDKVIFGCRDMASMNKLVFVSCDPVAASRNIVGLCRPTSKKYSGVPFTVDTIQPVDMFPQTNHFEWVVVLRRDKLV